MLELAIDWNPSKILFNLGSFGIRYYSLMFVIAFLLGLQIIKKIYKNDGVSTDYIDPLFMYVVIATLLGARLGEVFFYNWSYFSAHPIEILLPIKEDASASLFGFIDGYRFTGFQGLASHGAAIGIIIAMILYRKKYTYKSTLWILDRIVIPVASGAVFVRLGNLMNSEIVGKVTNSATYGFRFFRDTFGENEAMRLTKTNTVEKAFYLIENSARFKELYNQVPLRHPTQLYEAFSYAAIFAILWFVYWKTNKKHKTGYIFGLFLVLLWTVRFFIEFYKEGFGGIETLFDIGLNTGQLLCIPFVIAGFYFMFRTTKTTV